MSPKKDKKMSQGDLLANTGADSEVVHCHGVTRLQSPQALPVPKGHPHNGRCAEPPNELGATLRAWRLRRGLTLEAVGARVGCTKSYLSMLENGVRDDASQGVLARVDDALDAGGAILRAGDWARTPASVREHIGQARALDARGADEIREGLRGMGGLDAAWRSGRLARLVSPLPSATADGGVELGRAHEVLPRQVPLINSVAAGYPTEFTDLGYPARVADEYVRTLDVGDADAFAARVVGDSMEPEYHEGDIVVFSPGEPVRDGMDCFVRLEPDHTTTFKRVYFEDVGEVEGSVRRIRLQPLNEKYAARVVDREEVAAMYAAVSVTRRLGGK